MEGKEPCPVGELVGEPHEFVGGTGSIVEWDVLGDPRSTVEVCRGCVA